MFYPLSVQVAQMGFQKMFRLWRFSSSINTHILEHICSSLNICFSCQPNAIHCLSHECWTVTQAWLSLMEVINGTQLVHFWHVRYDHSRALQLQESEVYPPILPLLSTYSHLQMCSHPYLQMPCINRTISMQEIYDTPANIFQPKKFVAAALPFIFMEQLRSHSRAPQPSLQWKQRWVLFPPETAFVLM